jgi:[ribosomal protein S5]-alanine N-acetyltransferase
MLSQPILRTTRLILRAFTLADARDVQRLAGAREVAATTAAIPHPYEDGVAEAWISSHPAALADETNVVYAITDAISRSLLGAIGLSVDMEHNRAELGYWLGHRYWRNGYTTEAASEMLRYAFEDLRLRRVLARHFAINPASGRVMQKIGMIHEGVMRQHFVKDGQAVDVVFYGILGDEWRARQRSAQEAMT